MRMLLPPLKERREICKLLSEFFHTHHESTFRKAIQKLCRIYKVKKPTVEWYERIDWGHTLGRTYEDGKIILVHPENWKKGTKYNSEEQWMQGLLHEFGHYLFWVNPEEKADLFADRMVKDL